MLNPERWKEIEAKPLYKGSGATVDKACIMQMVSYVAGEKWSDHPECACPILTNVAIRLNDYFNDEHRQLLKSFIPLLVGTRMNDETQIARKRLFYYRNVTVIFPLILDAIKLPELAKQLRDFQPTNESMKAAARFLDENKAIIKKAADAYAYASAYASADAYASAYAYAYADAYASAYASAYAYAYAYASASAYAYAYASASAYASADAYASASAYAYAYAYASADAYASASADAYAYAKKLRDDIAREAVESLRLAIEIKISS